MKRLNLSSFVPIMDIQLLFGDDEIEVNIINNNPHGQPTILVHEVGGKDVDEVTKKEYTDFVLKGIENGELKIPDSIELNPLTGEVKIDEHI